LLTLHHDFVIRRRAQLEIFSLKLLWIFSRFKSIWFICYTECCRLPARRLLQN
jgi:hypothetical protein